ncbi:D-hexose-6-phosphate mutarotase [Carboxylicivirga sp. A043]|uniref:D-hexose-6-phosphate mutarotase n=1 Tax=Carboxylicivirga litoralis TaxID=2816963 RepID=UPI0021CB258B|nr:D-hexose-6-phosphate mutarotase [Carboxylicivirga sp. A043]MCU4158154.1 D-hexose-6-phosphate mutarotase [Carboxylicivirga sp. A043]
MNAEVVNAQWGIENSISFQPYEHTIVAHLTNKHASAKISLYGAHVLSFIPNKQDDILFVSPHAVYQEGKAIRGGIPICWPWFNAHPVDKSLPSHGFARISKWSVNSTSADEEKIQLELVLSSNPDTLKLWPYQFEVRLMVTLTDQLSVALTTINKGEQPFDVSAALHSYFNISDIHTVTLEGLENTSYKDDVENVENIQKDQLLSFGQRTDRRYQSTSKAIIRDAQRNIIVDKTGSQITVVWNPGEELAMQMPDLLDGYKHMLCVEAANSLNDTITIQPGQQHTLSTILSQ